MAKPVIVIMVKEPNPGRTKTRLSPPLSMEEAAELYEAMLRDTIALVADLAGIEMALAITPPEAVGFFKQVSPSGATMKPVRGESIGDCLNKVLTSLLSDGYQPAIAINSDGPTLPAGYLLQAVAELKDADLALGPNEDGGYYLIGINQQQPQLFEDIDWSTERVTNQTVARAEETGLQSVLLPAWYDVDTPSDMDRLHQELSGLPDEKARHCREFFSLLKENG